MSTGLTELDKQVNDCKTALDKIVVLKTYLASITEEVKKTQDDKDGLVDQIKDLIHELYLEAYTKPLTKLFSE